MILKTKQCENCRRVNVEPIVACPRCQRSEYHAEIAAARDTACEAHAVAVDPYSGGLLAWDGDRWIAIRDARIVLMCGDQTNTDKLVKEAMQLRDENKELLVENARLRRSLERAGGRRDG